MFLTWGGSDGKESVCNAEDLRSIPGLGRFPGEGNGCPLQCSGLENSLDRGAWQATVHVVAESDTTEQLSLTHFFNLFKDTNVLFYPLHWSIHPFGTNVLLTILVSFFNSLFLLSSSWFHIYTCDNILISLFFILYVNKHLKTLTKKLL